MQRSRVDLPQPDGPSRVTNSPFSISQWMSIGLIGALGDEYARVRDQEHLLLRTTYAKEVSHAMHWAERHLLPFLPAETHSVDA